MTVNIQVFSDYVCPYCYLATVPLMKAVERTGAQVVWRAYLLSASGPRKFAPDDRRRNEDWRNSVYPMAARLGLGGPCPRCDDLILVAEILSREVTH